MCSQRSTHAGFHCTSRSKWIGLRVVRSILQRHKPTVYLIVWVSGCLLGDISTTAMAVT